MAVGLLTSFLITSTGSGHWPSASAGTTPQRQRNPLDVMAGVPEPTVREVPGALAERLLNALAGLQADQVLRFGHLWSGRTTTSSGCKGAPTTCEWQLMSTDPDRGWSISSS